jgi:hypothetical protein
MARAIGQFLAGMIDNWALDDELHDYPTDDEMCVEICDQAWFLYDDVKRYHNLGKRKLPAECEAILERWSALLRSDLEWASVVGGQGRGKWKTFWARHVRPRLPPRPKFRSNPYWPFATGGHWEEFGRGATPPPPH